MTPVQDLSGPLPPIACGYTPRVNPFVPIAHNSGMAWLRASGLVPAAKARQLDKAEIPRLVGRFYPELGERGLVLAARILLWLFVLDDQGDETGLGQDPEAVMGYVRDHRRAVEGICAEDAPASVRCLRELSGRLQILGGARARAGLTAGLDDYFEGMVWEARNRALDRVPDLEEYLQMRPRAGAGRLFVNLIEPLHGRWLSVEEDRHPDLEEMRVAVVRSVCWINDLLSLTKERRHGDVHNLVAVLMAKKRLSWQAAVEEAAATFEEDLGRLDRAASRLWVRFPDPSEALMTYVSALRAMVRGTLDWTMESARYRA